jgi:hypothetical protein
MTRHQPNATTNTRRQAIVLQERDLDMLGSLAVARLLTTEALEWLHVPSWHARYRHWAERGDDQTPQYQPSSNLYRRLRGLCDSRAIRRIVRAVDSGNTMYYRVPDAYALTNTGAELLLSRRATERGAIDVRVPRAHAIQNLVHAIAIGRLYAALAAELGYRGRGLTDWHGDHLLARGAYDRLTVADMREPLPVLPDATFMLDGMRYFVEVDGGTRPLRTWVEKVQAYEAYRGSHELAARYATTAFGVLITAPTPTRLTRIAEVIARVTKEAHPAYRLLHADLVHPTTIRRGWQCIADVAWTPRQVVDRVVDMPSVTLAEQALWENTV